MNGSDLVQEFAAAFNRQDVPELLACFTEEAVYHDTFYGRHQGRAGLNLQLGFAPESLAKVLARRTSV